MRGLGGIVDRVAGLFVDIDATGEVLIAFGCEPLQLVSRRASVDTGNEHTLGLALRQQLHGLVDAGDTAGQNRNAVCGVDGLLPLPGDAVGEYDEADDEHDEQQDDRVEEQAHAAREAAEPPEMLRATWRLRLDFDVFVHHVS